MVKSRYHNKLNSVIIFEYIGKLLTNLLIVCCLTSSGEYFMDMQSEINVHCVKIKQKWCRNSTTVTTEIAGFDGKWWNKYPFIVATTSYSSLHTHFGNRFLIYKTYLCFSPVQWDPVNPDVQEHWPGAIHAPPFGHDVEPWHIAIIKKIWIHINV